MDRIVAAVGDRSPRDIAAAVARLIRDGELAAGSRLPTVRDMAAALGVSPATISHAWQALEEVGLIVARGRAGTFVLEPSSSWLPPRYRDLAAPQGPERLDLSTGTPDARLLPALAPAVARVSQQRGNLTTGSYLGNPVDPPLARHLALTWPFPAERLTVVDGALDAVTRVLDAVVHYGDRVAVESPGFPPILDLLDLAGATRVPVAIDGDGLRPDSLHAALGLRPSVLVLQPRAQNPTGASMSRDRAAELARILRRHPGAADTVVIEDDHSAEIAGAPEVSIGQFLPGRVVHVRSFSKSHGPDLRIAAVGGPAWILDRVIARRMLGPGWTSKLLQAVLYDLLTDATAISSVAEARRQYYARQRAMSAALAEHGLAVPLGDGINTWIPVRSEDAAIVRLAAAGIRVAPGLPFLADPSDATPHLRVTIGLLDDGFEDVAAHLAAASRA